MDPWLAAQKAEDELRDLLPIELDHVQLGGGLRTLKADFYLGVGKLRVDPNATGLRLALWDIAYGYVSGFRKRDIAYYVLTRSWSRTIWHVTYWRENPDGIECSFSCSRCSRMKANRKARR